jgi:hypothetical protein
MSWQMIEAARTGYDGLLRRQPGMCCDPVGNQLPALDIWGLDIDSAYAELFITEQILIVRGHIVFDEIKVAIDLANKIGLVATGVEITMPDLAIVIGSDCVVALANMYAHVPGANWPELTSRSIASYHRGTLCAPITVVVYFS